MFVKWLDGASRRWKNLSAAHGALLVALCGIVLLSPCFFGGFMLDDYLLQNKAATFHAAPEGPLAPLDLYDLFDNGRLVAGGGPVRSPQDEVGFERGWWCSPHLNMKFFRPLGSVIFYLDTLLFDHNYAASFGHSLLWLLALFFIWGHIIKDLLNRQLLLLSLLIFIIDFKGVFVLSWISNRHSLVAGVFTLLGFLAHIYWRGGGRRWALLLSLCGYLLGALASESFVSIMAFVFAYECVLGPGGLWKKCLALLPAALFLAGYLVFHRHGGYGARGVGLYIDPSALGWDNMGELLQRFIVASAAAMSNIDYDAWARTAAEREIVLLLAFGVIAIVSLGLVVFYREAPSREKKSLSFFVLGTLGAVAPSILAYPSLRVLHLAFLGGSVVVAYLLVGLWDYTPRRSSLSAKLALYPLLGFALIFWLIYMPLLTVGGGFFLSYQSRMTHEAMARYELHNELRDKTLIVLCGSMSKPTYDPHIKRFFEKPLPRSLSYLSVNPREVLFTRQNEHTLRMQMLSGVFGDTGFEQFLVDQAYLVQTDHFSAQDFSADIIARKEGLPTIVDFHFQKRLDDSSLAFATIRQHQYQRVIFARDGDSFHFKPLEEWAGF